MDVSLTWEQLRRPYWETLGDNKFTSKQASAQKPLPKGLPKVAALKRDVKALRQPVAQSQTSRFAQLEASRKAKRLDTHLANRGISSKAVMDPSTPSSTTGSEASELTTTTDHRKKMLNKWKQEKTALQNKPASNKPIFKPGGAAAAVPVSRQKPGGIKILPVQPPVVERRVTRQMAKATSGPVSTTTATTIRNNNKPISAQMKHLTISNKNNSGGTSMNGVGGLVARVPSVKKPSQVENKAPISQRGVSAKATLNNVPTVDPKNNRNNGFSSIGKDKPGVGKMNKVNKKPDEKMDIEIEPSNQNTRQDLISKMEVVAAPVVALPKKLKPQAIDSVYIEYTSTFVHAIKQLQNFSKYWRPVVDNTPDIPESIRDEIISSLGKIQLLLGSKLPQFAELLHSYLCKEVTPFPILECDLQGWWDVAVIQVNQVCSDFEKLKDLEANQWIQREENNVSIPLKKKSAPVSSGSGSKVASVKATATASQGMKAFLAMKRKAAQDGGSANATGTETSVDSNSSSGTPQRQEPEKKFEGGFFLVSSPARKSNASNRSSLRLQGKSSLPLSNPLLRTPGAGAGRRLSSNLSLLSLSLRNSMGPMYKLGAKGDANSELPTNSSE